MQHPNSTTASDPLRHFLKDHLDELESAAALLGGANACHNLRRLIDELNRNPGLSLVAQARLVSLVDLLSLEHVGDPDRMETGLFMEINLASPIVADICLLTDQLQSAIDAYGKWVTSGAQALVAPKAA